MDIRLLVANIKHAYLSGMPTYTESERQAVTERYFPALDDMVEHHERWQATGDLGRARDDDWTPAEWLLSEIFDRSKNEGSPEQVAWKAASEGRTLDSYLLIVQRDPHASTSDSSEDEE